MVYFHVTLLMTGDMDIPVGGVRGVSKSSSGIRFLAILTPALALSVTTSVGSEKTKFMC